MPVDVQNALPFQTEKQSQLPDMTGYLMALSQMKGFGPRTLRRLLDAADGNALKVWDPEDGFLKTHLTKSEKEKFLQQRSLLEDVIPDTLLEPYKKDGIEVIGIQDRRYPELLREIYDPPILLYIKGNVACLSQKQLAVVGNRSITDYGRRSTQALISQLAELLAENKQQFCITSGLAEGVDGQAHQSALDYGLPTMAVFGCGIDTIYPKFHEVLAQNILSSGGALVSEYPFGVRPTAGTFPMRNRIVAGMANAVLVIEGALKSGSLITAKLALEEGRQVLAVPGSIFSEGSQGPHQLIQQGAIPVTHGLQILENLGLAPAESMQKHYRSSHNFEHVETDVQNQEPEHPLLVMIPTQDNAPQGILLDDIVLKSGQNTQIVQEQLVLLELEGKVLQLAGGRVVKCRPGSLS